MRFTRQFVVFMVAFNLFAHMLLVSGAAADIGIEEEIRGTSDEGQREELLNEANNTETGAPTGNTLFGMYNVLSQGVSSIAQKAMPAFKLMYNAGVPGYIVGGPNHVGLLPPLVTIIMSFEVIMFLRGVVA